MSVESSMYLLFNYLWSSPSWTALIPCLYDINQHDSIKQFLLQRGRSDLIWYVKLFTRRCEMVIHNLLELSEKIFWLKENWSRKLIIEAITSFIWFEIGTLWLWNEQKKALVAEIITQRNPLSTREITLPLWKWIVSLCFEQWQTIIIPNAIEDTRVIQIPWLTTRNMVSMPLSAKWKIIWVVQAVNKNNNIISQQDLQYLRLFSSHATTALENIDLLEELNRKRQLTNAKILLALHKRDNYSLIHSVCVRILGLLTFPDALQWSTEEQEIFGHWAILHDVGKIAISDTILLKQWKLTDEEFAKIKTHPREWVDMLSEMNLDPRIIDMVHFHHEKLNWSWYPDRINDIPLLVRALSICDVFHALISKRTYKEGLSLDQAFKELIRSSGHHLDGELVRIFIEAYRQKREQIEAELNDPNIVSRFINCQSPLQ